MILLRTVIHILFVGNSLTYFNDLPSLVAQIANEDGVDIIFETIAAPDYALEDHLSDGSIKEALTKNKFDFLIAQQGPSAMPESQVLLMNSAIAISNECKQVNTAFGLYMVWPSGDRSFDRDNSIASYTKAAKASNALLCPAGLAWKLAWKKDKDLPLYGPDNFHPSIHGSVLAAMVIYAAVNKKKNLDFLRKSKWPGISDAELEVMKAAAIASINDL
jgi:hypothetical protein